MAKLIGISGSLRQKSYNTALLAEAGSLLVGSGSELKVKAIYEIPLYNTDLEESEGIPTVVSELKEEIISADGLVIATPEYNNSIPGVLKNTIDWLTRPQSDIKRVFEKKPVAILGASQGNFGTILAQDSLLTILRYLGTIPWFPGRLLVSNANNVFSKDGKIIDEKTEQKLKSFILGFAEFANLLSRK